MFLAEFSTITTATPPDASLRRGSSTLHLLTASVQSASGQPNPAPISRFSLAPYWPSEQWRTSTPEAQGIDSAQLVQMFDFIQQHNLDLHSLLIVRHGYLVTDAYFQPFQADRVHDIASCAKSVISALAGAAIDHGYLEGVDQKLLDFFPTRTIANLDARKQAITLDHLLTMSAGFAWDEWRPTDAQSTFFQLSASRDQIQFVLDRPMTDDPGKRWNYNSGLPTVLGRIIQDTSGIDIQSFAQRYLFEPLGINALIHVYNPSTAMNIALTPHDMAKFGYLYLQQGAWDGKPVLSPAWVQASTSDHVHAMGGQDYGYFWWLPSYGGYEAGGDGGQRIIVLPEQDMVVVITAGLTYPDMETVPDQLVQDYILPAVKSPDALPPNTQATAQLEAQLETITQPEPKPIAPLPSTSTRISDQRYALTANSIGLEDFALSFSVQEAAINMSFGGQSQQLAIGLDNTYRITPLTPSGPLYGWMAMKGTWQNANTFTLHLMMTGVVRNLIFEFQDKTVTV